MAAARAYSASSVVMRPCRALDLDQAFELRSRANAAISRHRRVAVDLSECAARKMIGLVFWRGQFSSASMPVASSRTYPQLGRTRHRCVQLRRPCRSPVRSYPAHSFKCLSIGHAAPTPPCKQEGILLSSAGRVGRRPGSGGWVVLRSGNAQQSFLSCRHTHQSFDQLIHADRFGDVVIIPPQAHLAVAASRWHHRHDAGALGFAPGR